jgi:ribosomal protein S18 acetylase RimI-like enzyme/predicted transcriptional regulator
MPRPPRRSSSVPPRPPVLSIRNWKPRDLPATRALLRPLRRDYPGFDRWLSGKLRSAKTVKVVVAVDQDLAAFAMSERKDRANVKLQTFVVAPGFRRQAIGQHLLYHEIRRWSADPAVERVYVTVASNRAEIVECFRYFGFRIEGLAVRRYPRRSSATELVMAKHFVREVVRTGPQVRRLADRIARTIWGIQGSRPARFGVVAGDLLFPAVLPAARLVVDGREGTSASRIRVLSSTGVELLGYDDEELVRQFHPLRLHLPQKRYLVVPIHREWVARMLAPTGTFLRLRLRVKNVYYCYPRHRALARGDYVLFYETQSHGGRGAIIGAAVVSDVKTAAPEALWSSFASLGVYSKEQVREHANRAGDAMAIVFTLFEPFARDVDLDEVRRLLGRETRFQALSAISRDEFEGIRRQGLAEP